MKEMADNLGEMFGALLQSSLQYLTDVAGFLIIILVGFLVARALRFVLSRTLRFLRLDVVSERAELTEILRRGGVKEPISMLVARIAGWLTVLLFFFIALNTLDVPQVEQVLGKFFLYVPNILVAAVILFVGYLLSNFLARAALIAAVNAGVRSSGTVSKLTRLGVFVFAVSMALEQLGIGKDTIVMAFTIMFGGIVLTLAIAFGLGGRDAARDFLDSRLRGQAEEPEKKDKDDEFTHI